MAQRFVTVDLPPRPGDLDPYGLGQIAVVDLVGQAGHLIEKHHGVIWCVCGSTASAERIAASLNNTEPADGGPPPSDEEPF